MMLLQGLSFPDEILEDYSCANIASLAGNALLASHDTLSCNQPFQCKVMLDSIQYTYTRFLSLLFCNMTTQYILYFTLH